MIISKQNLYSSYKLYKHSSVWCKTKQITQMSIYIITHDPNKTHTRSPNRNSKICSKYLRSCISKVFFITASLISSCEAVCATTLPSRRTLLYEHMNLILSREGQQGTFASRASMTSTSWGTVRSPRRSSQDPHLSSPRIFCRAQSRSTRRWRGARRRVTFVPRLRFST